MVIFNKEQFLDNLYLISLIKIYFLVWKREDIDTLSTCRAFANIIVARQRFHPSTPASTRNSTLNVITSELTVQIYTSAVTLPHGYNYNDNGSFVISGVDISLTTVWTLIIGVIWNRERWNSSTLKLWSDKWATKYYYRIWFERKLQRISH